jgi:hypothetical protein
MIGGWLWEKVGPQVPFAITAIVSLLSIVPVWLKFKIDSPPPTETPAETQVSE